jgi:hypothetical protein
VTVLTSSDADEVSHEEKQWGHGAFTKVLSGETPIRTTTALSP